MSIEAWQVEDFIALVTDGRPIDLYDPPCETCGALKFGSIGEARKNRFLYYGRAIMYDLSLALGCFGAPDDQHSFVSMNPSGPVVSGSIYLSHPDYIVTMNHSMTRYRYGDVSFSRPREYESGGWLFWEELRDVEHCASHVKQVLRDRVSYQASRARVLDSRFVRRQTPGQLDLPVGTVAG